MRRVLSEIVVIGSGVVGTATGKGFAAVGHPVHFVDIDQQRIDALRSEGLTVTREVVLPTEPGIIFLTLPTPNAGHRYDLSAMVAGTTAVGAALRDSSAFHTVVVRSTVPPGTCDKLVRPLLEERSGKRAGEGFALASNPEFLRAACALEDFLFPRMTVIAARSRVTLERLRALFQPFGGELRAFDDPATAELAKCCHNLYNAAKISFWNEMWLLSNELGLPTDEVAATVARSAEASFNPDYGIHGGAPYGGACLPKDTKGFLGFADDLGLRMPMLSAVVETNEVMERQVAGELDDVRTEPLLVDLENQAVSG